MNVNFISFKNGGDVLTLYSVSNDVKIMIGFNTNIIIKDRFRTLLTRY